jgi:hypothetical protein
MVPCAEVVALAILFADGDAHGWSRGTYGEHWGIATLTGVVNTATDTAALMRWEDGDHVGVLLEDAKLHGETLRRAQAALAG